VATAESERSGLGGDPRRYYRALRQHAVGDVIDAPFYGMRPPPGGAG